MNKIVGKVNPPEESNELDEEVKNEQLEKDKMTSEGGLPDTKPKPIIPSKLYFERKYKESTPRQFLSRILMREDIYERFHWY